MLAHYTVPRELHGSLPFVHKRFILHGNLREIKRIWQYNIRNVYLKRSSIYIYIYLYLTKYSFLPVFPTTATQYIFPTTATQYIFPTTATQYIFPTTATQYISHAVNCLSTFIWLKIIWEYVWLLSDIIRL